MLNSMQRNSCSRLTGALSLGAVLWLSACHASTAAPAEATTEQVRARLFAAVTAVVPGEQLVVGVQQHIIPHWHTYWINPGDSGTATSIEWTLPAGADAGPIQWPAPSRFTLGPITNYGYADEVTLLSTITVPQNAVVGGSFPIEANVDWLVCEAECIPQQATLGLNLPVAAAADPGPRIDRQARALIDAAQARLPVSSPWAAHVEKTQDRTLLRLVGAKLDAKRVKDVWFYPTEWGVVAHGAQQPRRVDGSDVLMELQPGDAPLQPGRVLEGVLVVTEDTGDGTIARGFAIAAQPAAAASNSNGGSAVGLASALLFAFLGGLILNLMPCVFPVLSMKALSLLSHGEETPARVRRHGVAYAVGVLVSFAVLGALLLALRAGGAQIGWGFQFQSPLFVLAMAFLMFAVGLSLSGVFYVGGSMTGIGSSLAQKPGYTGSFFTGVLATLVATPCTAPFMGAAIGYALSRPAVAVFAIFLSLGLGLALPYLALTAWPGLQRRLPRPGVWMERVKQALAFPMYAAAVWLVWVLAIQAGPDAIVTALGGMVAIAFGAWIYQSTRNNTRARAFGTVVAAVSALGALVAGYVALANNPVVAPPGATASASKTWESYSAERLQTLRASGEPVFLNFTAAWCITCLANERVALSDRAVAQAFEQAGVAYLKGDWTHQDEHITQALSRFGRSGVPLYVYYPRGRDSEAIVLPQILTPQIVLNTLGADRALLASNPSAN